MRRRLAIPALNEHGAKRTAAEAREGMELARRGVAPFIRAGRSEIFTRLGREAAERAARVRCRVGRLGDRAELEHRRAASLAARESSPLDRISRTLSAVVGSAGGSCVFVVKE